MSTEPRKVLILGAGVFGLGTALSLLTESKEQFAITVLDKAEVLPAPDAASTDISKIVRFDYEDRDYAKLGHEAISEWKQHWRGHYHECGVLVLGSTPYALSSLDNALALAPDSVVRLSNPSEIYPHLPPNVPRPSLAPNTQGYLNRAGGWAAARPAMIELLERIRAAGGHVLAGKEATELVWEGGEVRGARTKDGETWKADLVIIATGAWTPGLLKGGKIGAESRMIATGQSVALLSLNEEEVKAYGENAKVVLNFDTGHYAFPPNNGIAKFSRHHAGYLSADLIPYTGERVPGAAISSAPLPKEMYDELRGGIRSVYPGLAGPERQWGTRLCWYTDAENGDWIIDFHPSSPRTLLFATGGSGHAFKFLPNLGRQVRLRLEGALPEHLEEKWAFNKASLKDGAVPVVDASRVDGGRRLLDLNGLGMAKAKL